MAPVKSKMPSHVSSASKPTKRTSSSSFSSTPLVKNDDLPTKRRKTSSDDITTKTPFVKKRVSIKEAPQDINTSISRITAKRSQSTKSPTQKSTTKQTTTSHSSTRKSSTTSSKATKTKKKTVTAPKMNKSVPVTATTKNGTKQSPKTNKSTYRIRTEFAAAQQKLELEKQSQVRNQMKANRAARAAARGLPNESSSPSSSEEEEEEEDNTEIDNTNSYHESNADEMNQPQENIHSGKDSAAVLSEDDHDNSVTPRNLRSPVSDIIMGNKDIIPSTFSPIKKISRTLSPSSPSTRYSDNNNNNDNCLPNVMVKDHKGNEINLANIAKDQGAVVFAYPKANTPGCTKQACSFRDNYSKFKDLGFSIYGISYDNPNPQKSWKTKQKLPYTLLCSEKGEDGAIKALGASKPGDKIERSHWVFAKGGSLLDRVIGVKALESMDKAFEISKANPQI